jgi:hypothetical protein
MSRNRRKRPRSFSPAFDAWLRWNEAYEDFSEGRRRTPPDLIYLEDFFVIPDLAIGMDQMINSWVHLARGLRSAMKFRFEHPALKQIAEEGYSLALENVWSDTPIALPFPKTYVEIDIGGQDGPHGLNKFMMFLEERYADTVPDRFTEKYQMLGIAPGDKFISLSLSTYNHRGVKRGAKRDISNKMSSFPVELHIPIGPLFKDGKSDLKCMAALPEGIDGSGFMYNYSQQVLEHFMIFLTLCHAPNRRMRRVAGLRSAARDIIRKHRRKPMESTFYEHYVLEIPVGSEEPIEIGEGMPGSRHRLHAVRSFIRHYKQPLKSGPNKGRDWVIVPAHWRGDKDLGVVTKDYDFVLQGHDDDEG